MNMSVQIIQGDALERLRDLLDGSVQTCVTSPPYWGLRNYQTGKWVGGDEKCEHAGSERYYTEQSAAVSGGEAFSDPGVANSDRVKKARWREAGTCKCGARYVDQQLGLESTPAEYVRKMVAVFSEVKRVLRDDGTLWLNLGDSYSQGNKGNSGELREVQKQSTNHGSHDTRRGAAISPNRKNGTSGTCKPKDLIGLPWMVAFALRDDGWFLRSDIIWAKKNTMPESVTDRPTKSHEHIFLLTKRANYFYDHEAILEPCSEGTHARISQDLQNQVGSWRANGGGKTNGPMKPVATQSPASWKGSEFHTGKTADHQLGRASQNRKVAPAGSGIKSNESFEAACVMPVIARNKRDVWFVGTQPYSEAHFATFPPDLIKPCILAGSRPGDTVLDPFGGSGTTGMVALELGRKAILIELNPEYCQLIRQRTNVTPGLQLA